MDHSRFLYLSRRDVEAVGLGMTEIIEVVEKGLAELGNGRVEMPPKPAIHPGEGGESFIHAMPAYVSAMQTAGIKWVSGFPDNLLKGLPYISGLLILNDVRTGLPTAVMDCTWITGKRTGAASAISAKYLARPESETIGLLACGVQGFGNLEAMQVVFPLKKVKAYDVISAQAEKLARFGREQLGLEVEVVSEPRRAVEGCDIVVTSGPILKTPHATIQQGWLEEGTFVSCVDYDAYFSREALREADKWTTDHLEQYLHYQLNLGFFQHCPPVYAELGELVTGRKAGRESPSEINFAANLGLAMEDMVVAPLIRRCAEEMGIGTWLTF